MARHRIDIPTVARRLGTLLLVLLLSFGLGEVTLRVVDRFHPSHIFYDQTYNRFRGSPGSLVHGFRLNELGFHDDTFELDKGDRFRIVALGDSFAFGVVPYQHNYLTLLEQMLNDAAPPVEVLNMGIPRTGPTDQLALLRLEGLGFEPDLVLVSFVIGNDFRDVYEAANARKTLVDLSYVLSLVRYAAMASPLESPGTLYGRKAYQDDQPTIKQRTFLDILNRRGLIFRTDVQQFSTAFERTVGVLEEIHRVCAPREIAMVVVLCPDELQVDPVVQDSLIETFDGFRRDNTDFQRPNRMLTERLTSSGIHVLDLLPSFLEASESERLFKPRDTHWNIAGNRVAARAISDDLLTRGLAGN
jgi:hypothetical protein